MTKMNDRRDHDDAGPCCGGDRREFLCRIAALAATGVALDPETPAFAAIRALPRDPRAPATERRYPIPAADGVSIDEDNGVIVARAQNRVFVFNIECPHQNAPLKWRQADARFQCPRHESKYQPDGRFISGRATRNMDRFAIRRDGGSIAVDTARMFESDRQAAEWAAAVVTV
jgi:Rieske Fe-S protein